jgi:hypothetical protein
MARITRISRIGRMGWNNGKEGKDDWDWRIKMGGEKMKSENSRS